MPTRRTALAATTALLWTAAQPARAQELLKVTVASPPSDDATPLLYAQSAGLFRKAGLDVDLQQLASGSAVTQAVIGGSIDIGLSSTLPLILAHVKGVALQIVAPDGIYLDAAPYAAMVARSDSTIRTGSDMNGKTIGVAALKDTGGMASMAWIEQNGGDPSTVKQIEVSYPLTVAALEAGRIDAGSLIQPVLAQALATGKLRIVGKSYSSIAKRFLISAWFARDDYLGANAEAARRFARVMRDAAAYANAHRDETAVLLTAFTKVDLAVIRQSTRETFAETLDPADLQPVIDTAAKYKAIDARFDARDLIAPAALAPK
jgi:NitT/TauT family transport system substrate-binding protein